MYIQLDAERARACAAEVERAAAQAARIEALDVRRNAELMAAQAEAEVRMLTSDLMQARTAKAKAEETGARATLELSDVRKRASTAEAAAVAAWNRVGQLTTELEAGRLRAVPPESADGGTSLVHARGGGAGLEIGGLRVPESMAALQIHDFSFDGGQKQPCGTAYGWASGRGGDAVSSRS